MCDGPPRPSVSKHGLGTDGSHRYDIYFPFYAKRRGQRRFHSGSWRGLKIDYRARLVECRSIQRRGVATCLRIGAAKTPTRRGYRVVTRLGRD